MMIVLFGYAACLFCVLVFARNARLSYRHARLS